MKRIAPAVGLGLEVATLAAPAHAVTFAWDSEWECGKRNINCT
jgi:hypothetical protein